MSKIIIPNSEETQKFLFKYKWFWQTKNMVKILQPLEQINYPNIEQSDSFSKLGEIKETIQEDYLERKQNAREVISRINYMNLFSIKKY